jgi:hypothetical protein
MNIIMRINEQNFPNLSGVIVDTTAYILSPLKPVWEIYRDAVNEYLVPDVVKEWMNEKASKAEKGLQKWEKGLTSKQKVVLDTSIDGVKFGGDIVIVGSTTKLAGKLVLEGGVKKLVTKTDDLSSKKLKDFDNNPATKKENFDTSAGFAKKISTNINDKASNYAKKIIEDLPTIGDGQLSYINNLQKVSLKQALEAQALEKGFILAGGNSGAILRKADIYVKKYGGIASDYVKMTSGDYRVTDTTKIQTHWVENVKTGERYSLKVKLYEVKSGAK